MRYPQTLHGPLAALAAGKASSGTRWVSITRDTARSHDHTILLCRYFPYQGQGPLRGQAPARALSAWGPPGAAGPNEQTQDAQGNVHQIDHDYQEAMQWFRLSVYFGQTMETQVLHALNAKADSDQQKDEEDIEDLDSYVVCPMWPPDVAPAAATPVLHKDQTQCLRRADGGGMYQQPSLRSHVQQPIMYSLPNLLLMSSDARLALSSHILVVGGSWRPSWHMRGS